MTQLLEGLRVLDLSLWQPGHTATQLLADLGADVLKIEPPGGDRMRPLPDRFLNFNGHKRSRVLDLKQPADRARLLKLAAEAEVVVEGFKPGVAQRLGAGYDQLSGANPALVYCSISGFGQTGPLARAAGHDANYQAYAGAMVRPPAGGPPMVSGALIGDQGSGLAAAFAILAAVTCARRTGQGEHIDVSMTDLVFSWVAPMGAVTETRPDQNPGHKSPGLRAYATADGGWVVLGVFSEDHFWEALCRHLGLPDLAGLGMDQRLARAEELGETLQAVFATRPRDELVAEFSALGLTVAPVLAREEAMDHPHFWDRGVLSRDAQGARRLGHPIRYLRHPPRPPGPAPQVGEDGARGFEPRD
jgi:crotonobetainyl-CoA:carnitine CoA-transferase CaiB-like acyl-CoA transferase